MSETEQRSTGGMDEANADALIALLERPEARLADANNNTSCRRLLEALLREALTPATEAVTEAAE